MRDMYLPRWEAWVDYKLALLRGETAQEPDYFQIEKNWVDSDTRYDSTSTGNAISAVEEIYKNTSSNYNKPIKTFKYPGSPM